MVSRGRREKEVVLETLVSKVPLVSLASKENLV